MGPRDRARGALTLEPGAARGPVPESGNRTAWRRRSSSRTREFETKGGNTRYVVRDSGGDEYTTFARRSGRRRWRPKVGVRGIEYHEQQRGQYTNVYLDKIEPLAGDHGDEDTDLEEAGWRTAVDAALWLVGDSEATEEVPPDELFEKLKPFKDRVAEDIREDDD